MEDALTLIEKCLINKEPVLNLGNCGLSDNLLSPQSELGRELAKCTHLTTLILRNQYNAADYQEKSSVFLNTWYIYNDSDYLHSGKTRPKVQQLLNYFAYPGSAPDIINMKSQGSPNKFSIIPEVVGKLVNLKQLVCGGDKLEAWEIDSVAPIKHLSKLTSLILPFNKIERLICLRYYPFLEELDLRNNSINHLIKLEGHRFLKYLKLKNNRLTHLREIGKFPNLRWLDVSENSLLTIEGLSMLKALQFVDLSNNRISYFKPFERNICLKTINISQNLIKKLDDLGDLPNLQFLFARSNRIYSIKGINNLKYLKVLDLSSNMIPYFPGEMNSLEELKALDISNNNFQLLNNISNLKKLKILNAASNNINQIEYYGISVELEEINLNDNRLSTLTLLPFFPNLKRLFAGDNDIENVKAGNNPFLSKLILSNNKITDISFVCGCSSLESLDVSCNKLTNLNLDEISNLKKIDGPMSDRDIDSLKKALFPLKILNASNNRITRMPDLRLFPFLEKLILSGNQFLNIDNCQWPLSLLEVFLDRNNITAINNLTALLKIPYFDLSDNPVVKIKGLFGLLKNRQIRVIPNADGFLTITGGVGVLQLKSPYFRIPTQVSQDVESLKNWFLAREQGVHINTEIRCILFGNGETGKTALSHFLRTGDFYSVNNRTHGILINDWILNYQEWPSDFLDAVLLATSGSEIDLSDVDIDNKFMIRIWDFGGQEFYHATHRLFMSNDVLYLVLWEAKTDYQDEDEGIFPKEYWLNNIMYYAPESSVIFVQNRADSDFSVEENVRCKISFYDEKKKESIIQYKLDMANLRAAMLRKIASLSNFCLSIPKIYQDIKIKIQDLQQPYISFDSYESFCQDWDDTTVQIMSDSSQRESLLKYLDNVGSVVCFRYRKQMNDDIIKNYVFTNPEWLTSVIYEILKKDKDEFDLAHVEEVVSSYGISADAWIKIMQNFGLIFLIKTEQGDRYIVPQYLPVKCKDEKALFFATAYKKITHSFTVSYPQFMPNSNFLRLISNYGSEHLNYLYWKNGLVFFKKEITVFIECINNVNERKIRVSVQDNNRSIVAEILECILQIDPSGNVEISIDELNYVPITILNKKIQSNKLEVDATSGETLQTADFKFLFKQADHVKTNIKKCIRIFVSYSKKDDLLQDLLVDELKNHLNTKPSFEFEFFTDKAINMGADWKATIKENVTKSDMAIILVSASFASSSFIKEEELGIFLNRMKESGFLILPVLVRNYDFESFEEISGLQFFKAYYRDYGFKAKVYKNKFMPFDVLGEGDNITDSQLNNYCKNLADEVYTAVKNKFQREA